MAMIFRPTSAAAAQLKPLAKKLASKVRWMVSGVAHAMHGIFLLRALKDGGNELVTVIETPLAIAGAFGATNVTWPTMQVFVQFIVIDRAGIAQGLYAGKPKVVDGLIVPIFGDQHTGKYPNGTRLQVGALPSWSAGRAQPPSGRFNAGTPSVNRSALAIPVALGIDGPCGDDETTEVSLAFCRLTAVMPKFAVYTYTTDGGASLLPGPEYWRPWTPTGTDEPVTDLSKMGVIEFHQDELGFGSGRVLFEAVGVEEWAAPDGSEVAGIAAATAWVPEDAFSDQQIRYLRWRVTRDINDPEAEAVGEITWGRSLDVADIPGAPTTIPAFAPADIISWMSYTGSGYTHAPREAADVAYVLSGTFDNNSAAYYGRISAAAAVRNGASTDGLSVVTVRVWTKGGPVTLPGYGDNPSTHVREYAYAVTEETTYFRYVTLAVQFGAAFSVAVLDEFHRDRYGHHDELVERVWVPYCSACDGEGLVSILCAKLTRRWEVSPAAPFIVQGVNSGILTPASKNPEFGAGFQVADDIEFALVRPGGIATPVIFGMYMPWIFNQGRSLSSDGSLPGKLAFVGFPRLVSGIAYKRSEPFCQYSKSMVAVLVARKADFNASTRQIRVALIRVATGEVVLVGGLIAAIASDSTSLLTLTCYEQAVEDEDGEIVTHGKLLLSVSGYTNEVTDGFFVITEMSKIAWLSREPSNTWGVYAGSVLAPPVFGETMNADRLGLLS